MKTTTKILFTSMFFAIAIPSILFSSEAKDVDKKHNEEILRRINKFHRSDFANKSDENTLCLEIKSYTIDFEKSKMAFFLENEKELNASFSDTEEFSSNSLFFAILNNDEGEVQNLLKANANPDWKTEDDDITPFEIAFANLSKYSSREEALETSSEKALDIYLLLEEASKSRESKPSGTEQKP